MEGFLDLDWESIFGFQTPVLEIVIRGTLMYLILFLLLRFVLKRETGGVGISDLLLVVLLADAAQNALANDYRSITEGVVLVVTILFWNYALDWLGYHSEFFQRLVHPPPLALIEDGKLNRQNMRKELITQDELMGLLRENGVENVEAVEKAFMEGDGQISIVKKEG